MITLSEFVQNQENNGLITAYIFSEKTGLVCDAISGPDRPEIEEYIKQ